MKTSPPPNKSAFTLVELLVVTGIAVVLIALLAPAVTRSLENGRQARCAANLRQIGLGMTHWTAENDGMIPPVVDWGNAGKEFWYDAVCDSLDLPDDAWRDQQRSLFRCPAADTPAPNYTMSFAVEARKMVALPNASQRVIVAEGDGSSGAGISDSPPFGGLDPRRHPAGSNYLFADGHVEYLKEVPTNSLNRFD